MWGVVPRRCRLVVDDDGDDGGDDNGGGDDRESGVEDVAMMALTIGVSNSQCRYPSTAAAIAMRGVGRVLIVWGAA